MDDQSNASSNNQRPRRGLGATRFNTERTKRVRKRARDDSEKSIQTTEARIQSTQAKDPRGSSPGNSAASRLSGRSNRDKRRDLKAGVKFSSNRMRRGKIRGNKKDGGQERVRPSQEPIQEVTGEYNYEGYSPSGESGISEVKRAQGDSFSQKARSRRDMAGNFKQMSKTRRVRIYKDTQTQDPVLPSQNDLSDIKEANSVMEKSKSIKNQSKSSGAMQEEQLGVSVPTDINQITQSPQFAQNSPMINNLQDFDSGSKGVDSDQQSRRSDRLRTHKARPDLKRREPLGKDGDGIGDSLSERARRKQLKKFKGNDGNQNMARATKKVKKTKNERGRGVRGKERRGDDEEYDNDFEGSQDEEVGSRRGPTLKEKKKMREETLRSRKGVSRKGAAGRQQSKAEERSRRAGSSRDAQSNKARISKRDKQSAGSYENQESVDLEDKEGDDEIDEIDVQKELKKQNDKKKKNQGQRHKSLGPNRKGGKKKSQRGQKKQKKPKNSTPAELTPKQGKKAKRRRSKSLGISIGKSRAYGEQEGPSYHLPRAPFAKIIREIIYEVTGDEKKYRVGFNTIEALRVSCELALIEIFAGGQGIVQASKRKTLMTRDLCAYFNAVGVEELILPDLGG